MVLNRTELKKIPILYAIHGFCKRLVFEVKAVIHTLIWFFRNTYHYGTNHSLPIPPPRLRHRVHGNLDLNSFLNEGRRNYESLRTLIDESEAANIDCPTVLDFGCGCGRNLRHLLIEKSHWRYYATDIDEEAILWNSRSLPGNVQWLINNCRPPLPFPDNQFDIILAVSVFTHIDEELQFAWLKEFQRVLADSGIVIATIHGKAVWGDSAEWSQLLAEKGILHLRTNTGIRNHARTPDYYQTTLHTPTYVTQNWSKEFAGVSLVERGIGGVQDAVVLSKPL